MRGAEPYRIVTEQTLKHHRQALESLAESREKSILSLVRSTPLRASIGYLLKRPKQCSCHPFVVAIITITVVRLNTNDKPP
jgi:hypothetical protein